MYLKLFVLRKQIVFLEFELEHNVVNFDNVFMSQRFRSWHRNQLLKKWWSLSYETVNVPKVVLLKNQRLLQRTDVEWKMHWEVASRCHDCSHTSLMIKCFSFILRSTSRLVKPGGVPYKVIHAVPVYLLCHDLLSNCKKKNRTFQAPTFRQCVCFTLRFAWIIKINLKMIETSESKRCL